MFPPFGPRDQRMTCGTKKVLLVRSLIVNRFDWHFHFADVIQSSFLQIWRLFGPVFPVETLWCRENLAGTVLLHNEETRVQRLTLLRWKRIIRWMQRLLVWLTYSQSFDRWRIRKKFDRLIKYQKVSVALVITRLMFSRKIWWVKNSNNIGQDFIRRRFNQFAEKFNRMKSKIYGVWNRIAHKASARKYMVRVWFFLSKQPCAQNKFYNSGLGARLVA